MSAAVSLSGYQLRLAGFDGPLDVLLSMIDERRLEITTLSLVDVTDGFVAYVAGLVDPSPVLLADFIGVAARLLVLKSRALIPQAPSEQSEDDDELDIAQQLEQYRRMRAVGLALRMRQQQSLRSHGRAAAPLRRFVNTRLALPSLDELRAVYARVTSRPAESAMPRPAPVQMSIQEMIERILRRLQRQVEPLRFQDTVGRERAHVVAGFVALLALWSRRSVDLSQHDLFGEILIHEHDPAARPAEHGAARA